MTTQLLNSLESRLALCLSQDRHVLHSTLLRLRRAWQASSAKPGTANSRAPDRSSPAWGKSAKSPAQPLSLTEIQQQLDVLAQRINRSIDNVSRRQLLLPEISYPQALPVSSRVDDIKQLLQQHQVLIIAGETGSGKTTQIPKICLELGRGVQGLIGHTQPRRLAASTVAARIAEELGVKAGEQVGFQVRFTDTSNERTLIKLMTDGILLAETQYDPYLNRYDTLIIDEAHERSLNIDFLLGYMKRLLPKRPDLKVIITSATIDVEKFSAHFNKAPIVEVSGRTYPVTMHYRPCEELTEELELPEQVLAAFEFIQQQERQHKQDYRDVLVFLSGEKEIRETAELLRKQQIRGLEILPLYARLSVQEQKRVFESHQGRRIVLTTNVAETSLTVPGIGYVIDSGFARISRYSVRNKIQRLPIEPVSQASANQRAGRCGRLGPGTCVRLYSEADYLNRPAFTDTEITRTNLASVILQMLALKLGNIEQFPFLEMPDSRAVRDGMKLLEELQAVDEQGHLLPLGRRMAKLPLDPKLARVLVEAAQRHCLQEVLIIASALSIQDPRERPLDRQQAADEAHRRFAHPESDFWAYINLWQFFESNRQVLPSRQLRKFCSGNFLSYMRMREWREVHRQLLLICHELKLPLNQDPASYEEVHMSVLSGFLSQVAWRLEDGTYLGARSRKYMMFPGSVLHRKGTRWIVSAELVETSQLFARMNAKIEPEWAEKLAPHLIRREYSDPHWEQRQGQVMGFEKVLLYGLALVEKRKIRYAKVDPQVARSIFIQEGLVGLKLRTRVPFYHANKAVIEQVKQLEERTRRRDLLVDETVLAEFYETRLPAEVVDVASLERWYFSLPKNQVMALHLSQADLMRTELPSQALEQFPQQLASGELKLDLQYAFDPGKAQDGVSIDVPVSALKQLKAEDLDWLVPGLLQEKCIALIKALPKALRKNFVPVPDVVARVLPLLDASQGGLRQALARQLLRLTGVQLPDDCWDSVALPEHLSMNIRVLDERGEQLGSGRDLQQLRENLASKVQDSISKAAGSAREQRALTAWNFGDLPEVCELGQGKLKIKAYPALVDQGDSVNLSMLDSRYRAREQGLLGMARLLMLNSRPQVKYLQKELLQNPARVLQLGSLGDRSELLDQLVMRAYSIAFRLEEAMPRDEQAFEKSLAEYRSAVISVATGLQDLLYQILDRHQVIRNLLKTQFNKLPFINLKTDIEGQLGRLIYPGFLLNTPYVQLCQIPRYLQAIELRLEKYPLQTARDRQWTGLIQGLEQQFLDKQAYCVRHEQDNEQLDQYRWLLEELRVSLFAQVLGTRVPVSEKRLQKLWQEV